MAAQTNWYKPNWMLGLPQSGSPEAVVTTALVCNSSIVRSGLQQVLLGTPFVVAVSASPADPCKIYDTVSDPALVIIEATQNTGLMLEVVRQVTERSQGARIVVLADRLDLGFMRLAHEAGLDGFCIAASGPAVLIKSLELVMLGATVIPSVMLRSTVNELLQNTDQSLQDYSVDEPKLSELTSRKLSVREAQILNCLSQGASNKVIARKLDITEATIKVHIKAILRKIGVVNRTQAAIWATKHLPTRVGAGQHV
ncbi:LuxR C-terminal-related transcriptional regulator [Microvirga soli]|uniref:LuxR C-terminal-related transcriptional regulator n=1 Tax=Microvirga soli TaxID=1854496 RepID=UPI00191D2650|nr:response regulator transcription factor [Microvirga soli]